MKKLRVSIVGTAGVPASYGGFETLADNLVNYACEYNLPIHLSIYCSGGKGVTQYKCAELRHLPLRANGVSSILYDIVSIFSSVKQGDNCILLLGVSGAIVLPFFRWFSSVRIITNIDGVEWKREKWGVFAKYFLYISEAFAVRFSHNVIVDNKVISDYVIQKYGRNCRVITYGGDHALSVPSAPLPIALPQNYALALCRIEPENNVEMILDAFSSHAIGNLVFIGNWGSSNFGKSLKCRFKDNKCIFLLDAIYDLQLLKGVRERATAYIHGHSAGGTNPSLVEMMHFGVPVIAFDCTYNRSTTQSEALFFDTSIQLINVLSSLSKVTSCRIGFRMREIAEEHYTWKIVASQYFELLNRVGDAHN